MTTPLLSTKDLCSFYGDFQAIFNVSFYINPKEIVALVGSNGAGKSTFLRTLTGMLSSKGQNVTYKGKNIAGLAAHKVAQAGIAMAPEGRRLFPSLTVEENLLVGGYKAQAGEWSLNQIYDLFPILKQKRQLPALQLSGGQQQMVAIGRALMRNPDLLLLDEVSLGLAPTIIKDIYASLPNIQKHGTAVLIVEQNISQACAVADRLYCFQEGHVSLEGCPADLSRDAISAAYFGREDTQ